MHLWSRLSACEKATYTNSIDQDETPHKLWRLIRVCAVYQDKYPLGNGRLLKNVFDQALIHFALIGDKSSKSNSNQRVIPTSSQILSKINIGSMHTI